MWYNSIMRWLINSPLHFFVSKNLLLMTYIGRKSGKSYTTPMNYIDIEGTLYTLSSRDRLWWRNLRGGADVNLRLQGANIPARAQVIEDEDQVFQALTAYFNSAPQIAKYVAINLESDGTPNLADVEKAAKERVVVRTELN